MIKLSCVIPCRNEFPNVVHTIYSILHCWEADGFDPKEIEILLIDNCSDDDKYPQRGTAGTTSYLEGRSIYWNAVLRVVRFPIAGNHAARNKGAEIARGKYLFFSDAHMAYKPGFFKEILRTVDESGGLVHGCIAWMGAYPITNQGTGYSYSIKLGEEWKGCVDKETELLTKDGWKKWNEVDMKTEFATVSMETHNIEFQKPRDIVVRKHNGLMVKIAGRSYDALLTPYHRTIYQTQDISEWRIKTAANISSTDLLPIGTNGTDKEDSVYSDELVELVGWIITEGSYDERDGTITIVQYSPKNRERIKDCLDKTGIGYNIHSKRKDFRIRKSSATIIKDILPNKELTFGFINSLNKIQLEKLYRVMIDADGTKTDTNESFVQVNKTTTNSFQYLCVLIGKASKWYVKKPEYFKGNHFGDQDINVVSVKKNKRISDFKKELVNYRGVVWCPDLENGTVICRRNGHTYPSANTWNNYRLADDWWYIPAQGHCSVAVRKDQFLKFGGYPKIHRTYGGGEFYLDMKWWMFGSTVAISPKSIGFHLASGRGYSYNHDDYIENVLGVTYALGCDDWRERTYLNWLRKGRKEVLDVIMARGEKEYAPDRAFVEKHKVKTFNQLLVERPWDKMNDAKWGKHNGAITIFQKTWLDLMEQSPQAKEAYEHSKYQVGLAKFIDENLKEFVYKGGQQ